MEEPDDTERAEELLRVIRTITNEPGDPRLRLAAIAHVAHGEGTPPDPDVDPDVLAGIALLDHDFVPNTWPKRDECDRKVADSPSSRPRQCGRPRREHRT